MAWSQNLGAGVFSAILPLDGEEAAAAYASYFPELRRVAPARVYARSIFAATLLEFSPLLWLGRPQRLSRLARTSPANADALLTRIAASRFYPWRAVLALNKHNALLARYRELP